MSDLNKLADRVEGAAGPDRELDREIALLAGGWHRYTPSQIGRSNPGWISPEDFIGEYQGKNGPSPKLDSLHGTTIYREPPAYTASLDAAMTLVPEGAGFNLDRYWIREGARWRATISTGGIPSDPRKVYEVFDAHSAALATVAAALRARALSTPDLSRDEGRGL